MKTSAKGIDLIKQREGYRAQAYRCPAGVWTVGYGHTGKDIIPGFVCDEKLAENFLRKDVEFCEAILDNLTLTAGVEFNQDEFDALVSFIFNVGGAAFSTSTLRRLLIAGAPRKDVADQLLRWVNVKGQYNHGLALRRVSERRQFLGMQP